MSLAVAVQCIILTTDDTFGTSQTYHRKGLDFTHILPTVLEEVQKKETK